MCKPKILGDLGILDTNLMNTFLMAKWAWRLYGGARLAFGRTSFAGNSSRIETCGSIHLAQAPNSGRLSTKLILGYAWGQNTESGMGSTPISGWIGGWDPVSFKTAFPTSLPVPWSRRPPWLVSGLT
jgi:hypothetical protein